MEPTNPGGFPEPTPPNPVEPPAFPSPETPDIIPPSVPTVPSSSPVPISPPTVVDTSTTTTPPSPGVVPASTEPFTPPTPAADPSAQAVVGGGFITEPEQASPFVADPHPGVLASLPGRKAPLTILMAGIVAVFVLGGSAAAYFGYYMSPGVIYSQSLKNTGKGYDKIVDYITQPSQTKQKGYTGDGSYQVKSPSFSTDGSMAFKSDGSNGEVTFDVGVAGTRVKADIRTIKSSAKTPDIYIQASGIKGLGTALGEPDLDAKLATLDGTWISIDHTFFDSLSQSVAGQSASTMSQPTRDQVLDEVHAFGKVNQQYLFSTAKNKAVTKVIKNYGTEKIDGHKTYHYKIAFQKDNVKKYITAQKTALQASKLNDWLKKNKYDTQVYKSFDDTLKSADQIKSSDTLDVWMDVNHRVVYKIRPVVDPKSAENYLDIGLDYKGGSSYPFFISGQSKDSGDNVHGALVTTLDTKTGVVSLKLNVASTGSDAGSVTASFNFKPTDAAIAVTKPANAKPITQVLSDLGLGDIVNQYTQAQGSASSGGGVYGGIQSKARNTKRETDMASLQTQLEAFYSENGYYPSLNDMNSSSWLAANMKSLDTGSLTDPSNPSPSKTLVATPTANFYAYHVTTDEGASCETSDQDCVKYTLTATYEGSVNGATTYAKSNLD